MVTVAKLLGANGILLKPLGIDDLLGALSQVLEVRHLRTPYSA